MQLVVKTICTVTSTPGIQAVTLSGETFLMSISQEH